MFIFIFSCVFFFCDNTSNQKVTKRSIFISSVTQMTYGGAQAGFAYSYEIKITFKKVYNFIFN